MEVQEARLLVMLPMPQLVVVVVVVQVQAAQVAQVQEQPVVPVEADLRVAVPEQPVFQRAVMAPQQPHSQAVVQVALTSIPTRTEKEVTASKVRLS